MTKETAKALAIEWNCTVASARRRVKENELRADQYRIGGARQELIDNMWGLSDRARKKAERALAILEAI